MNPAKRYLQEIRKYDVLIDIVLKESAMWKNRALSITSPISGDRIKSSGDQQKMASAIDRAIDAERKADMYIDAKYEIINTIERLEDADQIELLYKMYVDGKTMQEVVDEDNLGRGYSWARGVHGRALDNIREIINNNESGGK